ncbi:MAG: hypothetical protein O2791_03890, partial [Bacteroidetes bacterium]|nr:hypothetical protein [Bacteroidota bacterium]
QGQATWTILNVMGQVVDQGQIVIQPGVRMHLDASSWPSGTLGIVLAQGSRRLTRWVVHE